jgi:hypothetical protein
MWGTTGRRQSHSEAGGESRYSMPSRNKNRSAAARLRSISSRQLRQFTNAYLLALVPILSTWNLTPLADISSAQRTGPALLSNLQEPLPRAVEESAYKIANTLVEQLLVVSLQRHAVLLATRVPSQQKPYSGECSLVTNLTFEGYLTGVN